MTCIHTYIHTYTYIHKYIYAYMHTYTIHTYIHACILHSYITCIHVHVSKDVLCFFVKAHGTAMIAVRVAADKTDAAMSAVRQHR